MKVCIAGSRNYPSTAPVIRFVQTLPEGTVVISGMARGVDTWAAQAARARGLEVIEMPAAWKRDGRAAGFIRNREMVELADQVVCFWDEESRGTADTIRVAEGDGKLWRVYGADGGILWEVPL